MKTFDEHMDNIRAKAAKMKRRRRIIAASCAGTLVLAVALTLFVPFDTEAPSVSRYQKSPYYKLIQGLNQATHQPPEYKNNYEKLISALSNVRVSADGMAVPGTDWITTEEAASGDAMSAPGATPETYEEVTDNQVAGVIEADIFKRSDRYIYHLTKQKLTVYSIDKENSASVGEFDLQSLWGDDYKMTYQAEMYLSADCTTVTVLSRGYEQSLGALTAICSLDVTDPANIRPAGSVVFAGSYISSRMVDGELLLTYRYGIPVAAMDFDKPETFLPTYGSGEEMELIGAENIVCPEVPTNTTYTVVAKLDGKSLEVHDTVALLSYSDQLSVSADTIFATRAFVEETENEDGSVTRRQMTEITGIRYSGEELEVLGSVQVAGSVKDQYSLDQQGSILRVAASTWERTTRAKYGNGLVTSDFLATKKNCSLYCIDLETWLVAASVVDFAPDGEEVTSARFDGDKAYICTAEVVILTDPVYYFDLSDIHNITYKQTPDIDGYSSSLIQFGDYLLGIGLNEDRELKIEAYRETQLGVKPVASYERSCAFSSEYKAYFIDREQNLLGLAVCDWYYGRYSYLLLHFDGYAFHVLQEIPIPCTYDDVRADVIDGWLYLLGNELEVTQVW